MLISMIYTFVCFKWKGMVVLHNTRFGHKSAQWMQLASELLFAG